MKKLSVNFINKEIKKQYSPTVEIALSDSNLYEKFKIHKSYVKRENSLSALLIKHKIDKITREKIIKDYSSELIIPGLKGSIRGKAFNLLVKNYLEEIYSLDKDYELTFEKNHSFYTTSQVPDWYLEYKPLNKVIIGMNQVDLWKGGAQRVRGSYYLKQSSKNCKNYKFVCVIANYTEIKTEESYVYKIFNLGFQCKTLCYLNNLKHIINSFLAQ